jgi:hypothetical protein
MSLILGASARLLALSVLTTLSFATVAQARMSVQISCSGDHLSKMTTMIGGMPDGPHKWEMYKHLAMVNTAMAKDGVRGCEQIMRKMHRHRHEAHGHGKMM